MADSQPACIIVLGQINVGEIKTGVEHALHHGRAIYANRTGISIDLRPLYLVQTFWQQVLHLIVRRLERHLVLRERMLQTGLRAQLEHRAAALRSIFVGRDAERARLGRMLEDAAGGRGPRRLRRSGSSLPLHREVGADRCRLGRYGRCHGRDRRRRSYDRLTANK